MVHIYITLNIYVDFLIKDGTNTDAYSLEVIGFSITVFTVFNNAVQITKLLTYYWNDMAVIEDLEAATCFTSR